MLPLNDTCLLQNDSSEVLEGEVLIWLPITQFITLVNNFVLVRSAIVDLLANSDKLMCNQPRKKYQSVKARHLGMSFAECQCKVIEL